MRCSFICVTNKFKHYIKKLCFQVLEISSYRGQLYDYLRSRMMAVAPNLTILMGELVGARLVAQAGVYLHWGFNVVS